CDGAKVARPLTQMMGGIPTPLTELVARMMEKDAGKRTGSYREALEQLEKLMVRTQTTQQIRALQAAPAKRSGGSVWVIVGIVGIVIIVGTAIYLLSR
ncbi:MAG: hypothetical protein NTV52_32925, partial [Acidobacteria bacterium]|nr:hypothetical protein [Acidobacteriota bacterium]